MVLERFIYIDSLGIASLCAQLRGEDVVETVRSIENSYATGLKLGLGVFGFDGSNAGKETRTRKTVQRPENMLREIIASLRANETLHSSLPDAITAAVKTHTPAWFEARYPFSVPPRFEEFNEMRAVRFVSGFPPYDTPSPGHPKITMSASLHHFPSAPSGQLSYSGHDALFFRKLNGQPHSYAIFGSVFSCGTEFQVKPYAIRI